MSCACEAGSCVSDDRGAQPRWSPGPQQFRLGPGKQAQGDPRAPRLACAWQTERDARGTTGTHNGWQDTGEGQQTGKSANADISVLQGASSVATTRTTLLPPQVGRRGDTQETAPAPATPHFLSRRPLTPHRAVRPEPHLGEGGGNGECSGLNGVDFTMKRERNKGRAYGGMQGGTW